MVRMSALVLASGLMLGLAPAASAAPAADEFTADYEITAPELGGLEHPHHRCHGMSSGTADRACGTLTGGPSGGLGS